MNENISEKREINQNNFQNQNNNPQIQQGAFPQQMEGQSIPYWNQQLYGQPAIVQPMQGRAIVINQAIPLVIVPRQVNWGTSPISTACPFCRNSVTTNVEQNFNCGTCFLCWVTGICLFACIQLCRGKDICCCDAIHRCPNCGNILGIYNSC